MGKYFAGRGPAEIYRQDQIDQIIIQQKKTAKTSWFGFGTWYKREGSLPVIDDSDVDICIYMDRVGKRRSAIASRLEIVNSLVDDVSQITESLNRKGIAKKHGASPTVCCWQDILAGATKKAGQPDFWAKGEFYCFEANCLHKVDSSIFHRLEDIRSYWKQCLQNVVLYRSEYVSGKLGDLSVLRPTSDGPMKEFFKQWHSFLVQGAGAPDQAAGLDSFCSYVSMSGDKNSPLRDVMSRFVNVSGRKKVVVKGHEQLLFWETLAQRVYDEMGQTFTDVPRKMFVPAESDLRDTGKKARVTRGRATNKVTSVAESEVGKSPAGQIKSRPEEKLGELCKELETLLSGLSSDGRERVCRQFNQEGISRDELATAIVRKISFLDLCEILQEVQRHLLLKSDYDLIDEIVDRVLPLNHDRQFIRSLQQADAGTFFQLGLVSNVILGETVMAAVENRAVKIDVRRGQPDTMFPLTQPGDRGPESADWSDTIIKGVYKGFQTVFHSVNSTVSDDSINVDVAVSELNAWAGTTLKRRRAAPYCVVQVNGADEKLTSYREAVRAVAGKLPGIRFLQQVIRLSED